MNVRPDVAVLDQPLAVRDPRGAGEADRGGRARVGDRHHEVGLDRSLLREPLAHADAHAVYLGTGERRVGPREVDVLEDAERLPPLRDRLGRVDALLVDHDELAGTDVALVDGADQVEGAGLGGDDPVVAEPAERERPDPLRVAEGEQLPLRERDDRVGALEPRHRPRDRFRDRRGVVRDQRRDHLGVGGGAERDPVGGEPGPQLRRVGQVAVVPDRDGAGAAVMDERLGVRPRVRAGRRVAGVPDRDVARQRVQLLLVEHLRDEPHVAEHRQPAAVGDRDPRRLLAAVLEREEAEVREPRHVALGGADAEDAAHQPCASRSSSSVRPSSAVAADDAEPADRDAAEPIDLVGRAGEHGLAAALAEPGARIVRQPHLGADAGVERRLRERDGEPAERDVVDERAARRRAPEELDRAPPRPRGRGARGGRRPRRSGPGTRSRRARPARRRRAGRRRPRARRRARARTSSSSPTQPTTGVGSIARPSVSL